MRRRLRLRLAFHAGEMLHVNLQRVALRAILVNQPASEFHFLRRNLVQRINLRVVDNGNVQAVFNRFVQKDRVQDALHRRQGLHARGAVFFLPG